MATYYFRLSVSYAECQAFYSGPAHVVVASESGERVQLPVSNLRPFIQTSGIHGRFRMTVAANNKITSFQQVG